MVADSSLDLSVPASASSVSICASTCRVWPVMSALVSAATWPGRYARPDARWITSSDRRLPTWRRSIVMVLSSKRFRAHCTMTFRAALLIASLLLAAAVAAGAFGAHALKGRLAPEMMAVYQTAVQYHFGHALGLFAIGVLASRAQ